MEKNNDLRALKITCKVYMYATRDEPHHSGVICAFYNRIVWVGADIVICVQSVEQRAQHTTLWGAGVKAEGCGEMRAHSLCTRLDPVDGL